MARARLRSFSVLSPEPHRITPQRNAPSFVSPLSCWQPNHHLRLIALSVIANEMRIVQKTNSGTLRVCSQVCCAFSRYLSKGGFSCTVRVWAPDMKWGCEPDVELLPEENFCLSVGGVNFAGGVGCRKKWLLTTWLFFRNAQLELNTAITGNYWLAATAWEKRTPRKSELRHNGAHQSVQ